MLPANRRTAIYALGQENGLDTSRTEKHMSKKQDLPMTPTTRADGSKWVFRPKSDAGGTHWNLPARAYHHTQSVKLARTIANLAGSEEIQSVQAALTVCFAKALPARGRPQLMMDGD
jgi:hypothetical protein